MATSSPSPNATVITHFGNEVLIQTRDGERLRAIPRQHLPVLATGDRIHYEASDSGHAVIDYVDTRHGILSRVSKNQEKHIAVNIDQALIVCAARPALKTGLIDRYLVTCEQAGLAATIVFNKIDLLDTDQLERVKSELSVYAKIGYPVLYVSAKTGEGIDQLSQSLTASTAVLVGHSAVGKSSLIKALIPSATPRIGKVSQATNKGRHTTTHTELYQLANEGIIIDSPGIREFGLKSMDAQQLAQGFREFVPFINQCKFRDCRHTTEPGCAIAQAVADGKISSARIESYRAILDSFAD
jgi:ribosome biogenesis GTPase